MNLSISYLVMIVGILCAKCLGFVRESVVAGKFGTSVITDIYFQVFSIANVIFAAVGVSLSILVVKSINNSICKNEKGFVGVFIKKSLIYSICAMGVMAVLGYPITKILLPGLSGDNFITALKLYYIMLPTLIFIVLAYTLNGVLQNKGKFFITAILSVPFNLIIIGSLLLGVKNIYMFGLVTTLGWASQFLFLLPSYFKTVKGEKLQKELEKDVFKDVNMLEIVFICVSNLVFQLLFVIDKSVLSGDEGLSSQIHYSSYLFTTVSSIFLAGMSAVFFPNLTKNINEKNEEKTNSLIRYTLTFMFMVFGAFLMGVLLYGENIIALMYERGSFTKSDTIVVSNYFKIYSLCIFGYITQELLFKIFYAKNSYKITVFSAIGVVGLNLIADIIFKDNPTLVVWSTAIICLMFASLMFVIMNRQFKGVFNKEFFKSVVKMAFATLSFLVFYFIFKNKLEDSKIYFVIPAFLGGIVYLFILWKTKILKQIFSYRERKEENQ